MSSYAPNSPRVFISYSWDSPEHIEHVLELSDRLRSDGIDCILDQYEVSPPEGWPRWMERQIRDAQFVLVICTETYKRRVEGEEIPGLGHGVRWEAHLSYQHLYNTGTLNTKFIPVLLKSGEFKHIPTPLQGTTYYHVQTEEGYEALYRYLTNQPRTRKPELGKLRQLPPRERKQDLSERIWAGEPNSWEIKPADFRSQEREPRLINRQLFHDEDSVNSIKGQLSAVQRNAQATREALNPRILERISRSVVREKYLPAIRRGFNEGKQRIIPIIGPAGYGKSTILGDIYDELVQSGLSWVALVRCNDLIIESSVSIETLATALGEGVCGSRQSIAEVALRLTTELGRGVLLIDTLDLVLNSRFVPALRGVLIQLMETGTTVVFTCRDQEYSNFLEPSREKLAGLKESVDRYNVPEFTSQEIREAAQTFVRSKPEINVLVNGQAFADRILALSADNRPIQEITCNPLLLALLCDLFAKDGNVPPDLTVSKLYRQYWDEKVFNHRVYGRDSSEAIAKEKLCLAITKAFFDMSGESLCESAYLDELRIDFSDDVTAALKDLLSEGVLERLPTRKIHFFHQTLLEYAIAYWLTRREAQVSLNHLLETLRQSDATQSQIHWWPVIRQLLTIQTNEKFNWIVKQLDMNQLAAFRAIAFAAASRDELSALRKLFPSAIELGNAYEETLRESVECASAQTAEEVWEIRLRFLQEGGETTAVNTAKTIGALLARLWKSIGSHLDEALEAISKRTIVNEKDKQSKDQRSKIFGWLLQPCLPLLEQNVDVNALRALRKHFFSFGYQTRSPVLHLHLAPEVPEEARRELLRLLVSAPIPKKLQIQADMVTLLENVLPNLVESKELAQWGAWLTALDTELEELPDGWDEVQAKAVGRLAANNFELLKVILQNLFEGDEKYLYCNIVAIGEAIRKGADAFVANTLLVTNIEAISPKGFNSLARLLKDTADAFEYDTQESLSRWLVQAARKYPEELILYRLVYALDALADSSIFARQTLKQLIKKLPSQKQAIQMARLLRFSPIEEHPSISDFDNTSQLFLVEIYRKQAKTYRTALRKLLEASMGKSKDVALAASHDLDELGAEQLGIVELLPLLRSRFPGVRVNCMNAITRVTEQSVPLKEEELSDICSVLASENDQAVAIRLYKLVARWVQAHRLVPPGVAETVGGITLSLIEKRTFEGGSARVAIAALKAIAQAEDRTLMPQLGEWTRIVLSAIDLISVEHGETEVTDLLTAVDRLDQQFLSTVVYDDCPELARRKWWRSLRAVAIAIRRAESKDSPLLDYILASNWCPPEVRSLILGFRGA
jgi:hypothetical protein